MAAVSPATVIIACPHCATRYRLARETVADGRLVQCANCAQTWQAKPQDDPPAETLAEEDRLYDPEAEARLDAEFEAAEQAAEVERAAAEEGGGPTPDPALEEIKKAIAPKPKREKGQDPALLRKRLAAFAHRQRSMQRQMPMGRLRHTLRIAGLSALMVLVGGGIVWRTGVVEQFPDMAGVYAAIGLPVNVIGLEFRDVRTLEMLSEGAPVLIVSGRVSSAAAEEVRVPPVLVALLGADGASLYEWSLGVRANELQPGESVEFEARLRQPPPGVARVRLSFANVGVQQRNDELAANDQEAVVH